MRPRAAASLLALCTALGLVVLAWDGPGRWLIRGAGGDVIAVVWLAALLQLTLRRWSMTRCALAATAFAFALEAAQGLGWVPADAPRWIRVALGATFDPFDLVAYVVGGVIAVAVGQRCRPRENLGEVFGGRRESP